MHEIFIGRQMYIDILIFSVENFMYSACNVNYIRRNERHIVINPQCWELIHLLNKDYREKSK